VLLNGLVPLNGLAPHGLVLLGSWRTGVLWRSHRRFRCPVYSEPYPGGVRVGDFSFGPGDSVGNLLEFQLSVDGEYMSARTELGWINVWCLRNRHFDPGAPAAAAQAAATTEARP